MRILTSILSIAIVLPLATKADPISYDDGVLTLDGRSFTFGELRRPLTDSPRLAYSQLSFLKLIQEVDPDFSGWSLHMQRSGIPARILVGELPNGIEQRLPTEITSEAEYRLDGYVTYKVGRNRLFFFPSEGSLIFSVQCSIISDQGRNMFCELGVMYPHAENIVFRARTIVPVGSLGDIGPEFEGVATRMVDIATCLDVTERPQAAAASEGSYPGRNPGFVDCIAPLLE